MVRTLDLRSIGRKFESWPPRYRVQPWATCASVTKQYNLVPANRRWCHAAGKVTVGLASHWPCVTDISGSPHTGRRPRRGRLAPAYVVLWRMVNFTFLLGFITILSPIWVFGYGGVTKATQLKQLLCTARIWTVDCKVKRLLLCSDITKLKLHSIAVPLIRLQHMVLRKCLLIAVWFSLTKTKTKITRNEKNNDSVNENWN